MHKSLIVMAARSVMLFLRTACLLLLLAPLPTLAQPRISVEAPSEIDLGSLYEGLPTTYKIALTNDGNRVLHISRVWTSCGCTAASLPSTDLAPGQRESLTVSFDTKDLQGPFKREVHVASDDSLHRQVDISFRGNVQPIVRVTPRYVQFGTAKRNRPYLATVALQNTIKDTLRVLSCSAPESQLRLSLASRVIPPDSTALLRVELIPVKKGKVLGQIEMKTDSRLKPVIRISYVGMVR